MEENPIQYNTMVLERYLREEGVEIRTATRIVELHGGTLSLSESGSRNEELATDVVIYASGYRPKDAETARLLAACGQAQALGDCVAPQGIFQAVSQGFAAGNAV